MTNVSVLHPAAKELARLLDPDLDAGERGTMLAHLANCAECAEALKVTLALKPETQEFASALAQPAARKTGVSSIVAHRRWLRPSAIAASLVLAVGLGVWVFPPSKPDSMVLRGGGSVEVIPAPGVSLEVLPDLFSWSNPNPGQFILSDAQARPLFEVMVEGGEVPVDGELAHVLSRGGRFLWQVDVDGRTLGPYPMSIIPTN